MDYLIVCAAALVVAALTLYSGFGVGTLLMPVFAIFFPVPVAIAATAVVHLANNLFKLLLVGRHAEWRVVALFAVPAVIAAPIGSWVLLSFAELPALATYTVGSVSREVSPVKLVVGLLIVGFALLDLVPRLGSLTIAQERRRWVLPLGGVLSGFFGGLSGHQGALRSAFLIKIGLGRDAYIGTAAVSAVLVDLSRLGVYTYGILLAGSRQEQVGIGGEDHLMGLVLAASVAAFVGTFAAARLRTKVTIGAVQTIVGVMLVGVGIALAIGVA